MRALEEVKVVPQVEIEFLTKYGDSCGDGFLGYFWIARDKLAPLGLDPTKTCTSNCGTISWDTYNFVLEQVNHADGNDMCGKCGGCGLAYLQLRMGGRLPADIKVGDDRIAYWCPYGETCEAAPLPLLKGAAMKFVVAFAVLSAFYVIFGMVYGRTKGAAASLGSQSILAAHPHHNMWRQVAGLVKDGVNFARSGLNAKIAGASRAYSPLGEGDIPSGILPSDPSSSPRTGNAQVKKSKSSGRTKRSKSKSHKDKQPKHRGKSKKDEDPDSVGANNAISVGVASRQLAEQRDCAVHSSQAKVVVTAL